MWCSSRSLDKQRLKESGRRARRLAASATLPFPRPYGQRVRACRCRDHNKRQHRDDSERAGHFGEVFASFAQTAIAWFVRSPKAMAS